MIKGLWDSGAGMIARALQQDVTANNLANLNTAAFKEDRLNFRDMVEGRLLLDRGRGLLSPERRLWAGFETRFQEGSLRGTGSPLDFALEGPGFFVVETPDGDRFSRAGHFFRSPDGFLVTPDGLSVLGTGGRIRLRPGPVELDDEGRLIQENTVVAEFRLAEFEDPGILAKLGRGLFVPVPEDTPPLQAEETRIHQQMLESSNIQAVEQMVKMIEQERMYTFAQRALRIQDESLGRTVSELGRVNR